MKQLLLAVTAVFGLTASGLAARATPIDFTFTGSLVTFTVPTTDSYQILAFGAQGGNTGGFLFGIGVGGKGAEIGGDFSLTAGETLQIAVGGAGGTARAGAGGGGSFVVGPGNTPLVIAGGGGGGGAALGTLFPGQGGLTGPDGGGTRNGTLGGTGGNGGAGGDVNGGGGGGGGFLTPGGNGTAISMNGTGGGAFPDLAGGSLDGGFGGGGGVSFFSGAGGGGGYSGGAGGFGSTGGVAEGGGGGSFDAGTDQILVADFQTGNGEVVITELVPEPASLALLGSALIGLAVVWRRRRPGTFGLRRG